MLFVRHGVIFRRIAALILVGLSLAACQTDTRQLLNLPGLAPPVKSSTLAPSAQRYETAALELANRLLDGRGVAGDKLGSLALYEKLGGEGSTIAQMSLANLYTGLFGVRRDPEASAHWVRLAANAGYVDGQATYGSYLTSGFGVTRNEAEGIRWMRKAADSRFSVAMRMLGDVYLDGIGVPPSRTAAYAWFRLAELNAKSDEARYWAANGRQSATLLLTPDEIDAGQALADRWAPGRDVADLQISNPRPRGNVEYRTPGGIVTALGASDKSDADADIPSEITRLFWDFDVNADGSYSLIAEGIYLARNSAAAHEIAQLPFTYQNKIETFEVLEAYTLKSDGRKLAVAPSAIMTQAAARQNAAPMFADESQKVIIYPSVEAGDKVYYRVKYTQKPYFPGQFSMSRYFERRNIIRELRIRVSAPETMALRTETHDLKSSRRTEKGRVIYEWSWENHKADQQEQAIDGYDRAARVFVSSFGSYQDIGRSYAEMSKENTAVTPAVRALADEITAGITDRRKQTEAIYDWVRRRIRYVQIRLGVAGSFVPHPVDTILTNQYGDCKDHAALFSALLAAKSIPSETVLINSGNSYTLAGPPTFASLNHVITWLPDFDLYVDTTAAVAPFGVLPFDQYGKPVVHASLTEPKIRRTPVLDSGEATITMKMSAKLGADGRMVGDADSSGTGPFAIWMRQQAVQIQSMGVDQAAKEALRSYGFDGTGRFQIEDVYASGSGYRVTGRFQTQPRRDLLSGNSFRPVGLLTVGSVPADGPLGPLDLLDAQGRFPTPCFSGSQIMEISIELPPGKRLRELPKGTDLKNKYASYRSTWTQSGRTVTVRREFASSVTDPVCVGEPRKMLGKMLDDIRVDYYAAFSLVDE